MTPSSGSDRRFFAAPAEAATELRLLPRLAPLPPVPELAASSQSSSSSESCSAVSLSGALRFLVGRASDAAPAAGAGVEDDARGLRAFAGFSNAVPGAAGGAKPAEGGPVGSETGGAVEVYATGSIRSELGAAMLVVADDCDECDAEGADSGAVSLDVDSAVDAIGAPLARPVVAVSASGDFAGSTAVVGTDSADGEAEGADDSLRK